MATETLGAHLRNLLSPYSTLIAVCKETNFQVPESLIDSCKDNLNRLIEFSNSEKMEQNLWRDENE